MTKRKYSEAEVREIFELATHKRAPEPTALSPAEGLTLADIQEIGQEVGLAPTDLARAAATVDARGLQLPRRTSLGMPISVGRTVPLPRALTDHEWEQLVAELRATFHARGKVNTQGGLREWTNGNLHAMMEPGETGYRLRLGTRKGDAKEVNVLGIIGVVTGSLSLAAGLFSGGLSEIIVVPPVLGFGGLLALVSNAVRLPRWARKREQQMDHIATRITGIMQSGEKS